MKIKHLVALLAIIATAPLIKAGPQTDYFLKLDGIDGESTDKGHPNEIELLSYTWGGVSNPVQTAPAAGKVTVHEINVSKTVDKSSTKLMLSCATGTHIKNATITLRKGKGNGNVEFLVVKLTDITVTSFQTTGDGDNVIDKISLSFSSLQMQTADGSTAQVSLDTTSLQ